MATEEQRQVAGTSQDSVSDRLCALFEPKGHLEKARQRTGIALRGSLPQAIGACVLLLTALVKRRSTLYGPHVDLS